MNIDITAITEKNDQELQEWISFIDSMTDEDKKNPAISFLHRKLMTGIEGSLIAYINKKSRYYWDESLLTRSEMVMNLMIQTLNPDGTVNCVNMASPPDTGFVTERAGAAWELLCTNSIDNIPLKNLLTVYIKKTCEALVSGGIHTPNHRWVVSAALSYGYVLFHKPEYLHRIEEWLSEGIDIDKEGQFSERSTSVYSPVTASALIDISRLLDKPELLGAVRSHLKMILYYFRPDGKVVTSPSRRQDSLSDGSSNAYFLPFMFMAQKDNDTNFFKAACFIYDSGQLEGTPKLLTALFSRLIHLEIPQESGLPFPPEGDFFSKNSGFFRSLREDCYYTLFGACDPNSNFQSGKSSNPSFLSFQTGQALLESLRIAPFYFGTGYFKAQSIERSGESYRLSQKMEVPYYDVLPKDLHHPEGEYSLTSAERYWSKMDFDKRDKINIQFLTTTIEVMKVEEGIDIQIQCHSNSPVPVALEFCFPSSGELTGNLSPHLETSLFSPNDGMKSSFDYNFLKSGYGRYSCNSDAVTFGPGVCDHDWLPLLEEQNFPPLRNDQSKKLVYMTLFSPFSQRLEIRSEKS